MNQYPMGLAALTASPYADSDVMNVRMTPREVAGLQQLAMSYGARQEDLYDPITGQPQFSFLKKILPMIAGAVLPGIPGVEEFAKTIGFGSQALGTALIVGGATGLIEGDLKKGLMAGLGAYSGAKIGEGLKAASVAGAPAEVETPQASPVAAAAKAGEAAEAARGTVGATAEATRLSDVGGIFSPKAAPSALSGIAIKPVDYTPYTPPPPTPSYMGGISALMKPEGRTAFMSALGNPLSRTAVFTGVANALTPEQKPLQVGSGAGEDIVYIPGGFNPQYGTGRDQPYQLPGQYYKRTPQGLVPYNPFQLAPRPRGFAQGGAVQLLDENMNPRWSFPHKTAPYPFPNQNYPLSTVMQANYQSNSPQPREVVGGYEPKIDPYTGEERFAEGGIVPGGPETFTPITISPYAMPTNDPNVLATRAYIEELNRRARSPYGAQGAGGMGGGTGVLGGGYPFIPGTGGAGVDGGGTPAGDGLGALAGSIAGSYLLNKGIGAGVDYLRDKFGTKEEPQPTQQQQQAMADQKFAQDFALDPTIAALTLPTFVTPQTALPPTRTTIEPVSYEGEEMVVREDPTVTQQPRPSATSAVPYTTGALGALSAISPFANVSNLPATATTVTPVSYEGEDIVINDDTARQLDADLQAKTRVGDFSRPLSSYLSGASTLGSGLAGLAGLGRVASVGIELPIYDALGNLIGFSAAPSAAAAASGAAGAAGAGAGTAAGTSGTAAAGSEAGLSGLQGKIIPGLQTALGAYEAFKGIESGNEARAALGGLGAGMGAASLAGYSGLASLGPIGLAAAAVAAIGASLVNTKEFGDVALRNYWNAVDQGRGFGQAPPEELAQGFINFYRTNKNDFAGQQAYGRTGNEDFVYDMTQVINNAVKSGKVNKDVDPTTMYKEVVEPWLNSMGSGPQNADAKRIQDFMMTDLIHNFMAGAPISNSQVKGDSKYKMVSERPVYAGMPPPVVQMYGQMPAGFQGRPRDIFATDTPFAAREVEREGIMPVAGPGGGGSSDVALIPERESIMPVPDFSGVDAGLIPEAPPERPERYESIMPTDESVPLSVESIQPTGESSALYEAYNPYAGERLMYRPESDQYRFAMGGAIGDDYNFGFAGGGMPPMSEYRAGGKLLRGQGDGMSDDIPAVIRGKGVQRAALADGEFVIPADVVSHLGNGSTNAGAKKLHKMMAQIRQARTGRSRQAPAVKTDRYLPA